MLSKKTLLKQLKKVPDPELGISVVDLGLIYDVKLQMYPEYIDLTV